MKYILPCVALLLFISPVKAQSVIDCSQCSNAEWGAEYNPATGGCAANPSMGCGQGCNCHMGLVALPVLKGAKARFPAFFGGAFTPDGGFRIDRPGPLAVNRVAPGDVAYLINGKKPNRRQFGTLKRPIRKMEATWGSDGRLRLRLWR